MVRVLPALALGERVWARPGAVKSADKTPCNSSVNWRSSDAEKFTAMILPLIAQLQCLTAQALVYLAESLRYNPLHEIAVQEARHAVDPFARQSSECFAAA